MSDSNDNPTNDTARFLSRPSALEAFDDPEAKSTLKEAVALELTPRVRNGVCEQLSLWHFSSKEEEDRVIAAFIAKKPSKSTQVTFLFPEDFLIKAEIDFDHDIAENDFDCIKSLHISADLSSEATRHELATVIVTAFENGLWSHKSGLRRVTGGKSASLVKEVLTGCDPDKLDEIKSTFPDWLEKRLAAS